MFVEAIELIKKAPGEFTSRALILLLGTRIVPFDEPTLQTITGELLSDQGISGAELVETGTLVNKVRINYVPEPGQEVVEVEIPGPGLNDADRTMLQEVLANQQTIIDGGLTVTGGTGTGGGLTTEQAQQLSSLYVSRFSFTGRFGYSYINGVQIDIANGVTPANQSQNLIGTRTPASVNTNNGYVSTNQSNQYASVSWQ